MKTDPYYEDDYDDDQSGRLGHDLLSSEVSSLDISDHAEHLDDGWGESLTDDEVKKVKPNLAEDLIKMLTQPDAITKTIVLNEILKRPDFD